ncbi:MAG: hypothetical protein A2Y38_10615 [Spirochaetes bacterium GWB1_59_5]|nr:MAG: hypothetical protein A2Y38_10615 [Spirochaetes bacterium GWB1_59_5]
MDQDQAAVAPARDRGHRGDRAQAQRREQEPAAWDRDRPQRRDPRVVVSGASVLDAVRRLMQGPGDHDQGQQTEESDREA